MDTLGKRIRALRRNLNMSQEDLAEKAGYTSKSAISLLERDERKIPNDKLNKIAIVLNSSVDYLLNGTDSGQEPAVSKYAKIPVLGKVQAGLPQEAVENIIDYEEIPAEMARNAEYFALKVRGDSMSPRICEGDVVIVKKQNQVENGDVAVVLVNGEEATLKRFHADAGGITLIPINENYPRLTYTPKQVESLPVVVIGKVVELRGKL